MKDKEEKKETLSCRNPGFTFSPPLASNDKASSVLWTSFLSSQSEPYLEYRTFEINALP
jgi:hypothetical protein